MCNHKEWSWNGNPEFIGNDEVMIPIKCDKCKKKGAEILKTHRIVWGDKNG